MEKLLSEITRKEWIIYEWIDITAFGEERIFAQGNPRTPDEAVQAAEEWDFLESVKNEKEAEGEIETG